jgi:hypothetical protein
LLGYRFRRALEAIECFAFLLVNVEITCDGFTMRETSNRHDPQSAMLETARIIGYRGMTAADFWLKANQLGIPERKIQAAIDALTQPEPRKQNEPRYELTPAARRACWHLLGTDLGGTRI